MNREEGQRIILSLLPPGVACEVWADGQDVALFPEESEAVRNAIDARRAEFARGRTCARRALATLGAPAQPILVGRWREPLWPRGFVGSITHSNGLIAAAIARSREVAALGIDAEAARALPPEVVDLVLTDGETVESGRRSVLDTVLFSAKESVFKALFPIAGTWIDFTDISVEIDASAGTFSVRPNVHEPPWSRRADALVGRFSVTETHVLTSCYSIAWEP